MDVESDTWAVVQELKIRCARWFELDRLPLPTLVKQRPIKIMPHHAKVIGKSMCSSMVAWGGLFERSIRVQHRRSHRKNSPDRFGCRAAAFYFNQHLKSSMPRVWGMSECCNRASKPLVWSPALSPVSDSILIASADIYEENTEHVPVLEYLGISKTNKALLMCVDKKIREFLLFSTR